MTASDVFLLSPKHVTRRVIHDRVTGHMTYLVFSRLIVRNVSHNKGKVKRQQETIRNVTRPG